MDRKNICELPYVLVAPNLPVVSGVNQFDVDRYLVADLSDLAFQNSTDFQFFANLLRVGLLAFVSEDGAARHHTQTRNLRKRVNQTLRDSVRQILRLRVLSGVDERHHGNRINGDGLRARRRRVGAREAVSKKAGERQTE